MKKLRKILLGSTDILGRENEDIFLDLDLKQTFRELKPDRYNNDFDLLNQFNKERNSSRSFFVYGLVDSIVDHSDNKTISIYDIISPATAITGDIQIINSSQGVVNFSDGSSGKLLRSVRTTPLVYNQTNLFNKRRGKYALQIPNYTGSGTIYLFIAGNNLDYTDQIRKVNLVFYDSEGNFVEYGTDTTLLGNDSSVIEINNDFPFFYNYHWIKHNISIGRILPTSVSFSSSEYSVREGDNPGIKIKLARPSIFGNEKVSVVFSDISTESSDYIISGPFNFSFAKGEQEKSVNFMANVDSNVEFDENIRATLVDFEAVEPGIITEADIIIRDQTPKRYATYNFQNFWMNRSPYNEINVDGTPLSAFSQSSRSILRSGNSPAGTRRNEEFYPVDEFKLSITNEGEETLLPVISGLNDVEQLWSPGQTFDFNIVPTYEGANIEEVVFTFGSTQPPYGINYNTKYLNLKIFGKFFGQIRVAQDIKTKVDAYSGPKPYTVTISSDNLRATIKSKYPGVPLNIEHYISGSHIVNRSDISSFSAGTASPLIISLYANTPALTGRYSFRIEKEFYKDLRVEIAEVLTSTVKGNNPVYLNTAYSEIYANYSKSADSCILSQDFKEWIISQVWIRGGLFIADLEGVLTEPRSVMSEQNPDTLLWEPGEGGGTFVSPNIPLVPCTTVSPTQNYMGGFMANPYPEPLPTYTILDFSQLYRRKRSGNFQNSSDYRLRLRTALSGATTLSESEIFKFGHIETNTDYSFTEFKLEVRNRGTATVRSPFDDTKFLAPNATDSFVFTANTYLTGPKIIVEGNMDYDPIALQFKKSRYSLTISNVEKGSGQRSTIFNFGETFENYTVSFMTKLKNVFGSLPVDKLDATENKITYYLFTEYNNAISSLQQGNGFGAAYTCRTFATLGNQGTNLAILGHVIGGETAGSGGVFGQATDIREYYWSTTNNLSLLPLAGPFCSGSTFGFYHTIPVKKI